MKWAGLLPFARLVEATADSSCMVIDNCLLTCLVDRWRPETHTFHFRWGEMAPTLEDVSFLLGLPLAGQPIGPLQAPENWEHEMSLRFQGINPNAGVFRSDNHGPNLGYWIFRYPLFYLHASIYIQNAIFPMHRFISLTEFIFKCTDTEVSC